VKVLAHLLALEPLGGVEQCVLEDTGALVARGHRVAVAFGQDGSLRPTYEALGSPLGGPFRFSMDTRAPWRMAPAYAPAARWARSLDVDVVWLNRFEHILWGHTVARAARRPLVCTLHEVPMLRFTRVMGRGVHHYTAVSDHVRDAWIAEGLPAERVTTVPNAVAGSTYAAAGVVEREAARRDLGLPPEVPVVLCYGRMIVEKGVLDLLQAWQVHRRQRVDAGLPVGVLVLLGYPDPARDPLLREALAAVPAEELRVYPATRDVVPHLRASDVVVFPSRMPEAFGRVVVEGMSTGRPVLATRVGAVPELLAGGMEALLVEAGDPRALGRRIAELVDWRRDAPGLGPACRAWVEERYPYTDHVDRLEAVLADAARRGPAPRTR
jgi:glycosyltransferase involved in cell wall biosynthesis